MDITAGHRSTPTVLSALWKGVRKKGGIHMKDMIIAVMTIKMVIVTVHVRRFPVEGTAGAMDVITKNGVPC